ncbi:Clavaminate synthase-like protein [Westerdykella ornata]|uniref:Clavaminate synthase-like protein n=1 Tax=Westerdykella ornata TaxID=318751 RepID=A0A6A6JVM9_WESOR|nr:Clavaminate synthase-like protein [Westerdykella ornata]KAF2280660.1 Clavaminate synthase-like protein [Westerdykella ornata]
MSSTARIPVIDILGDSDDVARQVLAAASTHGFLFIKNDGVTIPPQDIAAMFDLSRAFFSLPEEDKAEWAIHSTKAGLNRGWVRMQGESLDPETTKQGDPKEAFNIAEPVPTLQPLPPILSASSDLILRFQTACHTLCTRILTLLGTALQIPDPDWFTSRHDQTLNKPSGTVFRLLHYPKVERSSQDRDEKRVLAGAHSDYGSITLLFRQPTQSQAGLEVLTPSRTWARVPINPDPATLSEPPILVNIGDLLSFWTKGMLKSTVHRVVSGGHGECGVTRANGDRYSMAYFCHPLNEAKLEPVPSEVIRQYGDRGAEELEAQRKKVGWKPGEAITAQEHLERRLKSTYML